MNFFRNRFGEVTGRLSWLLSLIMPEEPPFEPSVTGSISDLGPAGGLRLDWLAKFILLSV